MRTFGFLIGVVVGWVGARLVGDQGIAEQQEEMQRVRRELAVASQSLADRTAEVAGLRAELDRLQGELASLKAVPPAITVAPVEAGDTLAPVPIPASDNLTIIEGIGHKIAALLIEHGICTFADLAAADVVRLREILAAGGPRFRMANPSTWPEQAELAARGAWDELTAVQSRLKAGV